MKKIYSLHQRHEFVEFSSEILEFHNEMRSDGYVYVECSEDMNNILLSVCEISKKYFDMPNKEKIEYKKHFIKSTFTTAQQINCNETNNKTIIQRLSSIIRGCTRNTATVNTAIITHNSQAIRDDPNPREALDIFHPSSWPISNSNSNPTFQLELKQAYHALDQQCSGYLEQLLYPLQCDQNYVSSLFGQPSTTSLRLLKYYYNGDNVKETCLRHTDRGFLTLAYCGTNGLYIKQFDTLRWIDVEVNAPARPCFVLFTGECLSALTGGYFKAIMHKVNTNSDRYSLPFFYRGRSDATLDTTLLNSEILTRLQLSGVIENIPTMSVGKVHEVTMNSLSNNVIPYGLGRYKYDKYWCLDGENIVSNAESATTTDITRGVVLRMMEKGEPDTSLENETQNISKVALHLRSVGEAPALKKNKFKIVGSKPILEVEKFLKKTFGEEKKDKSLYLYCGSGFSPTPDQLLGDLYDCFQVSGELVINYGFQEAWG